MVAVATKAKTNQEIDSYISFPFSLASYTSFPSFSTLGISCLKSFALVSTNFFCNVTPLSFFSLSFSNPHHSFPGLVTVFSLFFSALFISCLSKFGDIYYQDLNNHAYYTISISISLIQVLKSILLLLNKSYAVQYPVS